MRSALSILVFALAGPASVAQVRGPADVSVPVGRLAAVPLTIDGDEADYLILGENVDGFREYTTDPKQLRLRVIGYAPGTAYVVVGSVRGGKLQALQTVRIIVTAGPGPGPPPGPTPGPDPPAPPPPVDPLVPALRAAVAETGWPKVKVADYATGFRACADLTSGSTGATVGRLMDATAKALADAVPNRVPRQVAAVLDPALKQLDPILPPTDRDRALSDSDRAAARAVFLKIASALEQVAK